MQKVLKQLPKQRQTLFFSATLSDEIKKLAGTILEDPVSITISPAKPAVERIDQQIMFVKQQQKLDLLIQLFHSSKIHKAIVFIKRKHQANKLIKKLAEAEIRSDAIHGDKSQAARNKTLTRYKQNKFRVLVATDVASRGLDVDDITHVINFDLPMEDETYVHRIGRTARAGAHGTAISFCSTDEKKLLQSIEKLLGAPVPIVRDHDFHCEEADQSAAKSGRRRSVKPRSFKSADGSKSKRGKFAAKRKVKPFAKKKSSSSKPAKKIKAKKAGNRKIAQHEQSSVSSEDKKSASTRRKRRKNRPGKREREKAKVLV